MCRPLLGCANNLSSNSIVGVVEREGRGGGADGGKWVSGQGSCQSQLIKVLLKIAEQGK